MIFGKKKAIPLHDVEIRFQRAGMLSSPADLRKKVKILAIDDQNFPPEKNLSNSGFNVEVFSDIQRISDADPFPIVLCDVNGVGTSLSEDTQGAYVIDEIKKLTLTKSLLLTQPDQQHPKSSAQRSKDPTTT